MALSRAADPRVTSTAAALWVTLATTTIASAATDSAGRTMDAIAPRVRYLIDWRESSPINTHSPAFRLNCCYHYSSAHISSGSSNNNNSSSRFHTHISLASTVHHGIGVTCARAGIDRHDLDAEDVTTTSATSVSIAREAAWHCLRGMPTSTRLCPSSNAATPATSVCNHSRKTRITARDVTGMSVRPAIARRSLKMMAAPQRKFLRDL